MVTIVKYLFACVIFVASRQTIAAILVPDCDYVLCRNKAQQGDTEYYASGSAISSQFVLPDGSVITKSKESTSSSGGAIKQTFHELKKEADHFVQGGELGNALKRIPLTQFPKVPLPGEIVFPDPLNHLPLAPEFHSGGVQNSYQSQQSQSSSSVHQSGSQDYQPVAPVISSYQKEHELEKHVVSSHGLSGYQSGNVISEYNTNQQQSGGNTGTIFEHSVHFPSQASFNQKKDSTYYGQQYSNVQAPIVTGSQSSYEKFESSSQKKSTEVQPNIFPNLKPNTFSTNVVELTANKHTGQDGITTVVRLPTVNVPSQTREIFYEDSKDVNVHKENKYNAVPIVVTLTPSHSKYEYENQIKTEYGTGVKPAVVPLNSVQYGNNQVSHSQTLYVGTPGTSAAGLPSSHISPLTVHVGAPVAASQTYQKQESGSSQISAGHQVPVVSVPSSYYSGDQYQKFDGTVYSHSVPTSKSESYQKQESSSSHVTSSHQVPVVPLQSSFSGSSQYEASGSVYKQEGSHIPVANEQTSSHNKKASSNSQNYEFQSPIIVHGVPQNVQIDQQNGGTYKVGEASGSLSVPILVHGIPQTPNQIFSSSSSSGSSSSYYSSSKTGGSVAFPVGYDTANKIQGASSSIYDKVTQNSDAETLCSGCIEGVSSANIPVQKNSYGISTSFKSSSRTINGQKTENREASVAVNDNGKIDSYHVKS